MRQIILILVTSLVASLSFAGQVVCTATQEGTNSIKLDFIIDFMPPASKIIFSEPIMGELQIQEFEVSYSSRTLIKDSIVLAASTRTPQGHSPGLDFIFNNTGDFLSHGVMTIGDRDILGQIHEPVSYNVNCQM